MTPYPLRMTGILMLAGAAGLGATANAVAGDPWKDSLKTELESIYSLTTLATLSDRITKQGTVVVARKDGITADLASDMRYSVTKVTDGLLERRAARLRRSSRRSVAGHSARTSGCS